MDLREYDATRADARRIMAEQVITRSESPRVAWDTETLAAALGYHSKRSLAYSVDRALARMPGSLASVVDSVVRYTEHTGGRGRPRGVVLLSPRASLALAAYARKGSWERRARAGAVVSYLKPLVDAEELI